MEPRRLRLALLLTVLSAGFHEGLSSAPCEQCTLPTTTVPCVDPCVPGGTTIVMEAIGGGGADADCMKLKCPTDESLFADLSPTPKAVPKITCNSQTSWEADGIAVTGAICTKKPPCEQCTLPTSAVPCLPPCVKGGTITMEAIGGSGADAACQKMKCPNGDFLFAEFPAPPNKEVPQITCNIRKEWVDEVGTVVKDAICIKKLPCEQCTPIAVSPPCAAPCLPGSPIVEGVVAGANPACKKLTCPPGELLLADLSPSIEAVSQITCNALNQWEIGGSRAVSTAVCIKKPECAKCTMTSLVCTGEGCTGSQPPDQGSTAAHCTKLTCPSTVPHFIRAKYTSGVFSEGDVITEIKCNDQRLWEDDNGTPVEKAICITGFECKTRSPLSSDCDPLYDALGCANVPNLADDSSKVCTPPDKLYYQKAGSKIYDEVPDGGISCTKDTGEWQDAQVGTPLGTGNVVCAKNKPVLKKSCQDSSSNPLKSDCTSITDCKEFPLIDDASPFACQPATSTLYVNHNSGWKAATTVVCNPRTGFWMEGAGGPQTKLAKGDNIVCSALDLTVPACERCKNPDLFALAECGDDCIPGSIPHSLDIDPTTKCKKATCTGNDFFAFKYSVGPPSTSDLKEIHCDASSKFMDGVNQVKEAVCISGYSCAKKNPISSNCDGLDAYRCELAPLGDDTNIATGCNQAKNKKLFIKTSSGPDVWAEHTDLKCDKTVGEWRANGAPIPSIANVVCAESKPGEALQLSCQGTNNLKSDCLGVIPDCDQIPAITDDPPLVCTGNDPRNLYVYRETIPGAPWWVRATDVKCDKSTGKWMEGASSENELEKDATVICANIDPVKCTAVIASSCEGAMKTDPDIMCKEVSTTDIIKTCADPDKLYFLEDPNTKWMEAISIKCMGAAWQIEYNFGTIMNKKKTVTTVKAVCALKNPTSNGCDIGKFNFDEQGKYEFETQSSLTRQVEAGFRGECYDKAKYEMLLSGGIQLPISSTTLVPACRPDGEWEVQDSSGPNPELDGNPQGKKLVCRRRKCLNCVDTLDPIVPPTEVGTNEIKSDSTGECKIISCPRSSRKFVVDISHPQNKYIYYSGDIICDGGDTLYKIEDRDQPQRLEITKAMCIQHMSCTDPGSLMIKTENPPGLAIDGFEKIILPASATYNTFGCPTPTKKILIKKDDETVWDDVKKINCDEDTAMWNVELLNGEIEKRDYKNTIVCADSNPEPRPTTTLPPPTTTPKPELICDLCERYLPNVTEGGEWDKNGTIIKAKNDNVCVLKPKTGTTLIISDGNKDRSFNEEVQDGLECKRPEEGSGQNPVWTTSTGAIAKEMSARRDKEPRTWKYEYIVIVVALLFIGGMAIGCGLIYFRMRKQPSSREKKKKERGVTKKYTSAGVVRTGGRSSGGSREAAKSTDPTKSKMEDNEDAPTLKL